MKAENHRFLTFVICSLLTSMTLFVATKGWAGVCSKKIEMLSKRFMENQGIQQRQSDVIKDSIKLLRQSCPRKAKLAGQIGQQLLMLKPQAYQQPIYYFSKAIRWARKSRRRRLYQRWLRNAQKRLEVQYAQNLAKQARRLVCIHKNLPCRLRASVMKVPALNMKVRFAYNKADILPEGQTLLRSMLPVLKYFAAKPKYKTMRCKIIGHTDSKGSSRKNRLLSKRRAQAVFTFLQSHGVSESFLRSLGMGESTPIATNKTAEGRARNRRVEFKLYWKP